MGEIILQMVVFVGLTLFIIRLIMRWGAYHISAQVEARFRAVDTIVNQERVPEDWIAPYREKISALRATSDSEQAIERLGHRAQRHCLKKIAALMRFFGQSAFFDTPDSQRETQRLLQNQRERWQAADWRELVSLVEQDD
jgi:hypothetical protein